MKRFQHYLDTLSRLNYLGKGSDICFLFHGGMLFSSPDKWWGDFKKRASTHEGIDITYYRDSRGNSGRFDHTTRVPAMEDGTILNICNDFLGRSIITEPLCANSVPDFRLLYVYAHVTPFENAVAGARVWADQEIAFVCPTDKNPQMPPHLHFSCFEVPVSIPLGRLDWDLFSKGSEVRFIHPLFL